METSTIRLDDAATWIQITDGIEDYSLHVMSAGGDNYARVILKDIEPVSNENSFILSEGEGFSSLTHPGKVWAKLDKGNLVLLAVNK